MHRSFDDSQGRRRAGGPRPYEDRNVGVGLAPTLFSCVPPLFLRPQRFLLGDGLFPGREGSQEVVLQARVFSGQRHHVGDGVGGAR